MTRRVAKLCGMLLLLGLGAVVGTAVDRQLIRPEVFGPVPVRAAALDTTAQKPSKGGTVALPAFSRETPVTQVVKAISPSVVTVGAIKKQLMAQPWYDNFYIPRVSYFEARQRVPYMGSGFVVDRENSFVVTNYHVIEDSDSVFVTTPDGHEWTATVVDADKYIDVALLKVDTKGDELPPAIEFGDADDLLIGEQVMAIGNPFGNLIEDSRPTVTVGYVSALNRTFRPDLQNERVYADMIQTDAAINPGNSGGPLVDIQGRAVGMNTFIFSPSGGSIGLGFAIPIDRIKTFVEEIRTYGKLRPLLLDFDFRTVRSRTATGVKVVEVNEDGPADKAGLKQGDILLQADGRDIASREDFYLLFASKQVGETIKLKIGRGTSEKDIEYKVQEATPAEKRGLR